MTGSIEKLTTLATIYPISNKRLATLEGLESLLL